MKRRAVWLVPEEMWCEKTGAYVDFGNGHIYAGDAFKCDCGNQVIVTNPRAGHFPNGCSKPVVVMLGCIKTNEKDPDYV